MIEDDDDPIGCNPDYYTPWWAEVLEVIGLIAPWCLLPVLFSL